MLEALVTLVLVSAGLLGLASLQATLAREADVSRQRGKATQLGQERIEVIRSLGWTELPADGSDTISTGSNTDYTRRWTLGGTEADGFRPVHVAVDWLDRANTAHSVALNSVIARTEPAFSGGLDFVPPLGGPGHAQRPENRPLNIPFPARRLNDREIAYEIDASPDSKHTIVIDTQTGSVVRSCANLGLDEIPDEGSGPGCSAISGYVVAGHLWLRADGQGVGARVPPWPTGISLAQLTGLLADTDTSALARPRCRLGAVTSPGGEAAGSAGHRPYLCLLPMAAPGDAWSGSIYLAGLAGADALVCRYQFRHADVGPNERNQQPYQDVHTSLENQNYLIAAAPPGACPGLISAQDAPLADLVEHQDCSAGNPDPPGPCPAH